MEQGPEVIKIQTEGPEEIEYERKVVELEARIAVLKKEIAELEKEEGVHASPQQVTEITKDQPRKTSRRSFLGKAGLVTLGVGAMVLSKSIGIDDNPPVLDTREKQVAKKSKEKKPTSIEPTKTIKETVEAEIQKCKEIIEQEKYEEVLGNPCIVSALYYSPQAIEKMTPPRNYRTEKIISEIYPLITKKFRENYIHALKIKGGPKIERRMTLRKVLDRIRPGKNLHENHLDAIDLFSTEGSPVYSMVEGLVVLAENNWSKDNDLSTSSNRGGNTVIVFNPHTESFYRYAHLKEVSVRPGMILQSGKKIGIVGHTGVNASKPGHGEHLHFEINKYDRSQGIMIPIDVFELKRKLEVSK